MKVRVDTSIDISEVVDVEPDDVIREFFDRVNGMSATGTFNNSTAASISLRNLVDYVTRILSGISDEKILELLTPDQSKVVIDRLRTQADRFEKAMKEGGVK